MLDEATVGEVSSGLLFSGFAFYDTSTQCTVNGVNIHCCPLGSVMVGAHVTDNVFKCMPTANAGDVRFADYNTQRNAMRACPLHATMVGFHASRNILLCQWQVPYVTFETADGSPPTTDAYPMHVCPSGGFAMSGIHVSKNLFTCGR